MTECTKDPVEDLGSGVKIERRYLDGKLDGLGWWHVCNGSEREDFISLKPEWPSGWDVLKVQPLTLFPSILCRACKFHGYITNGRWCPA